LADNSDLELTKDEKILLIRLIRKLRTLAIVRDRARKKPTDNELSNEPGEITLFCSFCGRSQLEVDQLIAGPTVYICDACVSLCVEIQRDS